MKKGLDRFHRTIERGLSLGGNRRGRAKAADAAPAAPPDAGSESPERIQMKAHRNFARRRQLDCALHANALMNRLGRGQKPLERADLCVIPSTVFAFVETIPHLRRAKLGRRSSTMATFFWVPFD